MKKHDATTSRQHNPSNRLFIALTILGLFVGAIRVHAVANNPNLFNWHAAPTIMASYASSTWSSFVQFSSGSGAYTSTYTSSKFWPTPRPTSLPVSAFTPNPVPTQTTPVTTAPTPSPTQSPNSPFDSWTHWNDEAGFASSPTPTPNEDNWDAWFSDSATPTPQPITTTNQTLQPSDTLTPTPTAIETAQPTKVPNVAPTPNPTPMDTSNPTGASTPIPPVPTSNPTIAPPAYSLYQIGPMSRTYFYSVDGKTDSISLTTYAGLDQYLASLPRSISYNPSTQPVPSEADFIMRDLNEPNQAPYIQQLADQIKAKTPNADDQARVAISLVQRIPYDSTGAASGTVTGKYPYEVLYTDTGVCQEKSELLADLFKDLGFGTAIFRFDAQNHETVGIQCPTQNSYLGSGYCFIETTIPTIPTYSNGNYGTIGKLTTTPNIIAINSGAAMTSISQEYADGQEYDHLVQIGPVLSQTDFATWQALQTKYGLNAR